MEPTIKLDPGEAPRGYRAVLKSEVATQQLGNICRACDWRTECQKPDTDFTNSRHRCMSYAVVTDGGVTVQRKDMCSVVFKRSTEESSLVGTVKESLTPQSTASKEQP